MENKDDKAIVKNNLSYIAYEENIIDNKECKSYGRDIVYWGRDNKFPQKLWGLYSECPTLQAIIDNTTDYISGNKVTMKGKEIMNRDGETMADLVGQIGIDRLLYGGFAIQVIYNKLFDPIEYYVLDFEKCRVNLDLTKVYYSDSWASGTRSYTTYDTFKSTDNLSTKVLYFKGKKTRGVYPLSSINGSLKAVETQVEIQNYHLNAIKNNFAPSAIVNMNNGLTDPDTKKKIEDKMNNKFSGTNNAAKMLISWNQNKESATTIDRLEDDNFDKKYENLAKSTKETIFTAYRMSPILCGISNETKGFAKTEYNEVFELYNKTVVRPIQQEIIRAFKQISADNEIVIEPFKVFNDEKEATND